MTNLTHDIQRKRAEAESLPSVDEWLAAGNKPTECGPPRSEHMLEQHKPRTPGVRHLTG